MDIEYELQALHRNLLSTTGDYYVTKKQVFALLYLMVQGLPDRKDRKTRIAVLRAWNQQLGRRRPHSRHPRHGAARARGYGDAY